MKNLKIAHWSIFRTTVMTYARIKDRIQGPYTTHNLVISACPVPTYFDCTAEREKKEHDKREHV